MLNYALEIVIQENRPWEVQSAVSLAILETVEALSAPCIWRYSDFELGDVQPQYAGLLTGGLWCRESTTEKFRDLVSSGVQIINGIAECFFASGTTHPEVKLCEQQQFLTYSTLDNTILSIRTCDGDILSNITNRMVQHLKAARGYRPA